MQSVYAYKQSEESNYELALDVIREKFAEELSIVGNEHKEAFAEKEKLAIAYFDHNYKKGTTEVMNEQLGEDSIKAGAQAVKRYQELLLKDFESFKIKMVNDTEKIYVRYLRYFKYLFDLAELSKKELDLKIERGAANLEKETQLHNLIYRNEAIALLKKNTELKEELESYKLTGEADWQQFKEWYVLLKKDNTFFENFQGKEKSFENDRLILRYLIKDFFFKNEALISEFERQDLLWAENRTIIRSMLLKTLKSLEEGVDSSAEILSISRNWDEDKEFFLRLYEKTINDEEEYQEEVIKHSKKWASDRIAKVDQILINMAIAEMMSFPNIPVKVTINEFIEISKIYSTPKSWQFINGILDSISNSMMKSGKIRKSGRGLIDNR
ncbi:transcription antitermination factor NusB [Algivirga pacifica]